MRVLRVVLVAVVVGGASLVTVPPAAAFGGCAAGQIDIVGGGCVDILSGSTKGGGSITVPASVNKPGGVLAASNGTGGTVAQNAARAAANGSVKGVSLAGRLGQAGTVLSGFSAGYWLGSDVLGPLLCGNVSDWFCTPDTSSSPDFVANVDVSAGSVGWVPDNFLEFPNAAVAQMGIDTAALPAGSIVTDYFAPYFDRLNDVSAGAWILASYDSAMTRCGAVSKSSFPGSSNSYYSLSGLLCGGNVVPQAFFFISGTVLPAPSGFPTSSVMSAYYPPGSVFYTAPSPNPERTLTTSVVCSSPSGPDVTVTATSSPFVETDATWPQIPVPHCPSGSVPAHTGITESGPSGDRPVWDVDVPADVQSWQQEYPQCLDGGCTLRLFKIGPAGGDLGDCFLQSGRCEGWFAEPEPQRSQDYECRYGLPGQLVAIALSNCYVYSPTFDVQQQAKGIPTGDPATGDIPDTITDSTGDPAPDPGDDGGSCWPSGWGAFNPLAWVYMPVKCAVVDAFKFLFVPSSTAVQAQLQTTWETVRTRPPVSVVYPVAGFVTGFITNAGGTCEGAIADFGDGLVIPCQPPEGIAVFITILRWIVSVLFAGYTAFVIWGMVEKSFSR